MATATQLITAAEYARLPDLGYPTELVEGEIVRMNMPVPRHGQICMSIGAHVKLYLLEHPIGHVCSNDSGILTRRDPDSVRGGDVWYISYEKIPPGPLPGEYLEIPPDIIFEVLSKSDRRSKVLKTVSEYLACGVSVVCVVDPALQTVRICTEDSELTLSSDDELTFPHHLPGFRVPVRDLFT